MIGQRAVGWVSAGLGALILLLLAASLSRSGPAFDDTRVAPWPLSIPSDDVGVALARADGQTLILTEVSEEGVVGVPLGLDPINAYVAHGLDGLMALRASGQAVHIPLAELRAPVASPPPHIGSGNNFLAHAEEVGLKPEPALYPKLSSPTAWNAPVPWARRLDYEAELCAVALTDLYPGQPAALGFVLCNDFTDRWAMMWSYDRKTPPGTTGLAEGKGGPGRLPTGPWMVIPSDPRSFADTVKLRLSVNERLRQRSQANLAIWDHTEIVKRAFDACALDFRLGDEPVKWPACEHIPAGTLLLGGTPHGVIFRLESLWAWWLYLSEGDRVITEGTGLGRLVNYVEA